MLKQHKKQQNLQLGDALFGRHLRSQNYSICLRLLLYVQIQSPNAAKNKAPSDDGALFFATFGDGAKIFFAPLPCLGALPLLYPAAPPSVFAFGKYTAPAVALGREYVVELQGVLSGFLRSNRLYDLKLMLVSHQLQCLVALPLLYLRI